MGPGRGKATRKTDQREQNIDECVTVLSQNEDLRSEYVKS